MAIAEVFLGAFLNVLFDKLAYPELIRLARSAGIYSELEKWYNTLNQIQAVLVDAGQKHLVNTAIQLWLNKFHHLAYDIDDVLDDLATEAMRRQLNQQSHANTSKVLKFISDKFHSLKYGRKMVSKLDEITSKLHALVEETNILGLISNVERSNITSRRSEETSLVDVSGIVGREGDKEALLEKLLANESCHQNVRIVSIVGLGGIGKTTLAQILYNEEKVKKHFELTSWVCVSDVFDVFNISKAIYKDVGGEDGIFETLNQLQVALSEKLSEKRFLIVLDDVWNEKYTDWELLQRPFAVGAHGSRIMVTTRKNTVASAIDSVQAYRVEVLSNEEALSLLAQHALGVRNFELHPTFKLHGEGIVKKCHGLPLALKALGRVLRTKTSEKEWEELLNSEIWNLHNESKILPALRLSYYDLPPHLKRMFAYCCLFPKDYMFDKDELVLLWIAEGFLYESKKSKSMENLGRECFKELESRSLFQRSTNDKSRYTMHGHLNDLATSVAGEFFFMLGKQMDLDDRNDVLGKFHHFSFIRQRYGVYKTFKALQRARRLRTFLPMSVMNIDQQSFYLSNNVLVEVLPRLTFLRVLSLANYSISKVPQSIGSLKHVRYLNFSKTSITCLPEQIGDLYNLQSLLVSGCRQLSSLPHSLVKLVNLRHLDINDTPELNETPAAIGGLTSLQTLSKVIIGGASGFKISDLKDLLHLQGQLSVKGLHKVINATNAMEANLKQKKGLLNLELDWSNGIFDDTRNERVEYEVLEGLRPGDQLISLKILYYGGTKFPSWVGDPSFICLSELTLRGCRSCTCLPTLGHLSMLQKLVLESMNGLTRLGLELLGSTHSYTGIAFPSLEFLGFRDMPCWEEWSTSDCDKDGITQSFPRLSEISIEDCPKLDVVAVDLMPSFQILHVKGCSVAVVRSMVGVSSSIIRLTLGSIKGLTQLPGEILECLQTVEYLSISKCDELTYLCGSEAEACDIMVSLQTLKVSDCVNLLSLVERNVNLVIREVAISNCPKLKRYNCPKNIEMLDISDCYSLTTLTFLPLDDLPSTLKFLKVERSDNLELNWLFSNFLSSLGTLRLNNVSNVRLFPEGCLVHLTDLTIWSCDNIESIPEEGFGFLPLLCLRYLTVGNCKNIKLIPHQHLQSLTSLELMSTVNCPSMDYSFPSGMWPPNLSILAIGMLKKGMSEWGMQHFPNSLDQLGLIGGENSGVVTFTAKTVDEEDMRRSSSSNTSASSLFLLPSSLTYLYISCFDELESVRKGMEHLNCLEELKIYKCPKLRDLPETLLPSFSSLIVINPSPELKNKCRRRKGKYWPIISQIPRLIIKEDD